MAAGLSQAPSGAQHSVGTVSRVLRVRMLDSRRWRSRSSGLAAYTSPPAVTGSRWAAAQLGQLAQPAVHRAQLAADGRQQHPQRAAGVAGQVALARLLGGHPDGFKHLQ